MTRSVALLAWSLLVGVGCAGYLGNNQAREARTEVPDTFGTTEAQIAPSPAAQTHWDTYFSDPDLKALIETALANNQELNMRMQEIIIARAEVAARRGEYIPKVDARVGAGIEKVGRHTSQGASDEDHGVPVHLPDFRYGFIASWEADIWGRLRKARKAAKYRYLASIEAKNFVVTQLVAEIADSYYDLVTLDKQVEIVERNIELQQGALEVVMAMKAAGRGTQLHVQRFHAEVLKNQGLRYDLEQQRIRVENRINFLVGRFPQPVQRNARAFDDTTPVVIHAGVPSELLHNRPDVRQAQLRLEAAKLDTKAAKARFYPALSIEAGVGYETFNPRHIVATPDSLAYNVAGNLIAPLLNRAAIAADYRAANAMQVQAVYDFERALLRGYTDVANQIATLDYLTQRYERLSDQVQSLKEAIDVSNILYRTGEADYMEVLMTRRDSLEAEMELVETRKRQMQALVGIYQALGGGWRKKEQADAVQRAADIDAERRRGKERRRHRPRRR